MKIQFWCLWLHPKVSRAIEKRRVLASVSTVLCQDKSSSPLDCAWIILTKVVYFDQGCSLYLATRNGLPSNGENKFLGPLNPSTYLWKTKIATLQREKNNQLPLNIFHSKWGCGRSNDSLCPRLLNLGTACCTVWNILFPFGFQTAKIESSLGKCTRIQHILFSNDSPERITY